MGHIQTQELSEELLALIMAGGGGGSTTDPNYYTREEIDAIILNLNSQLDNVLTTDKVYTKSAIDTKLKDIQTQINTLPVTDTYTKDEINSKISNINSSISSKLDAGSVYTKTEVQKLITDTIAEQLALVTDFYSKSEIDDKISICLTSSDIIDSISNTATNKAVSANQISVLNQKIESLKQSASTGKSTIAAAITSVNVPTSSNDSWITIQNTLSSINKKLTADDFINQRPIGHTVVGDFMSYGETGLDIPQVRYDEFNGNIYLMFRKKILVLNNNYEVIYEVDTSVLAGYNRELKVTPNLVYVTKASSYSYICISKSNYMIIHTFTPALSNATSIYSWVLCDSLYNDDSFYLRYEYTSSTSSYTCYIKDYEIRYDNGILSETVCYTCTYSINPANTTAYNNYVTYHVDKENMVLLYHKKYDFYICDISYTDNTVNILNTVYVRSYSNNKSVIMDKFNGIYMYNSSYFDIKSKLILRSLGETSIGFYHFNRCTTDGVSGIIYSMYGNSLQWLYKGKVLYTYDGIKPLSFSFDRSANKLLVVGYSDGILYSIDTTTGGE